MTGSEFQVRSPLPGVASAMNAGDKPAQPAARAPDVAGATRVAGQQQGSEAAAAAMRAKAGDGSKNAARDKLIKYMQTGERAHLPSADVISKDIAASMLRLVPASVVDELGVSPEEATARLTEIKKLVQPIVAQQRVNELLQRGG